ncbi:MAG: hypothetical protein AAF065_15125 [Verrucomicrobiota bacterium]
MEKPDSETENRVGRFFLREGDRVGENNLSILIVVGENGPRIYDACRAASLTHGGEAKKNGPVKQQSYSITKDKNGKINIRNSKGRFVSKSEFTNRLSSSEAKTRLTVDSSVTNGLNTKIYSTGGLGALSMANMVFEASGVDFQFVLPMTSIDGVGMALLQVGSQPGIYEILGYRARIDAALNARSPWEMLNQLQKSNIEHLNRVYLEAIQDRR